MACQGKTGIKKNRNSKKIKNFKEKYAKETNTVIMTIK